MKTVLIVALLSLSLTACGASAPAGPPSQATVDAAMAQIDAGLADASPTAAPLATEAPQPTSTPAPTAAVSSGLGLTRDEITKAFIEAGFTFSDASTNNAPDRVIGASEVQSVLVEILGPALNVTSAGVFTVIPKGVDSGDIDKYSATTTALMVKTVAPDHYEEILAWISEQYTQAANSKTGFKAELATGLVRSSLNVTVDDGGSQVYFAITPVEK